MLIWSAINIAHTHTLALLLGATALFIAAGDKEYNYHGIHHGNKTDSYCMKSHEYMKAIHAWCRYRNSLANTVQWRWLLLLAIVLQHGLSSPGFVSLGASTLQAVWGFCHFTHCYTRYHSCTLRHVLEGPSYGVVFSPRIWLLAMQWISLCYSCGIA